MELTKTGFKQTEVGSIPEDWKVVVLSEVTDLITDGAHLSPPSSIYGYPIATVENINKGYIDIESCRIISKKDYEYLVRNNCKPVKGDVLLSKDGTIGITFTLKDNHELVLLSSIALIRPNDNQLDSNYLSYSFKSEWFYTFLNRVKGGSALKRIVLRDINKFIFPLPPTLTEQKAIATALSDVDALISSLEKLIAKKKAIKQGAMQELLTPPHKGGKRLAGFSEDWEFLTIELVADCLDNLRVPLNGEQRAKMNGDIPYCGANGVVDYVNDFVIDDDIILMAEDGGYFDEYKTRPIAYRMKGKCWVNNHAHILKAKKGIDQGFLYFSLVHKNILDYINGGTRAKLNKGEMNKIECWFPQAKNEQKAIAQILTDMDSELVTLEKKKEKYQQIKQGMMQELLTGKTRLV
jgi:type I restriction enzyme S subunit